MRRILGILTVLLLLAAGATACGDDSGDTAGNPTTTPSTSNGTPAKSTEVAILSETAAGGTVSTSPVPLPDDAAVAAFAGQFEKSSLGDQIAHKVKATDVPDGQAMVGAVIAIGCDVPPGVTVSDEGTGLAIVPDKVASPMPECFAPVTSVALVLVDAELV
ncbi:hypothetical protein [Nocardioides sp.]|uniref:hypothetical protein n=1 Tax=Nocardioides sp. TaxID=35761 RepID=UPI0031FE94B8|nr:hypothetical protein [Nocardioides sp.]